MAVNNADKVEAGLDVSPPAKAESHPDIFYTTRFGKRPDPTVQGRRPNGLIEMLVSTTNKKYLANVHQTTDARLEPKARQFDDQLLWYQLWIRGLAGLLTVVI